MIKVIDNLLAPSYCDSLVDLTKNHLMYDYITRTSPQDFLTDTNIKDAGQLSCVVFDPDLQNKVYFGWAYEQLKPIFYTVKDMCPELGLLGTSRVKFNVLLKQDFKYHYNQPHMDSTNTTYSMVYYLNDGDGDTFLFNEKYGDEFSDFTVMERISPKKNRAVIFEANRYHASSNPSQAENRYVLNWVFFK